MAINFIKQTFGNVLFNSFEAEVAHVNKRSLKPAHFLPINSWLKTNGDDWIDQSTNDLYLDDDKVRLKCLALFIATPITVLGLTLNIINRTAKLISFAAFWHKSCQDLTACERIFTYFKDLFIIILTPIFLLCLILSSLYGIANPNDGRKLYASFERAAFLGGYVFGDKRQVCSLLAPCFQPFTENMEVRHLFGNYQGW